MKIRLVLFCSLLLSLCPPIFAGTLLRTGFETADWPTKTVATSSASVTASVAYGAYGTIVTQTDVANNGVDVPSKGLLFTVNSSAAGAWKASLSSGVLGLTTANTTVTNLGLITLSFQLRASRANPIVVRLESYDSAGTTRTGGLSTLIYPATANYYQRFALDLSTIKPDGAGTFVPTATKISVTFELDSAAGGDGWPAGSNHTLKIDNLNYATPAYYVAASGGVDAAGKGTFSAPFATANYAMGLAQPGDIIVVRGGTYNSAISFRKYISSTNSYVMVIGDPDAWVVLRNYPGEIPVIRSKAWGTISIGMNNYTGPASAYLEIRGMTTRGYSTVDANGDRNLDPAVGTLQALLGKGGEVNCSGIAGDGRSMTNLMHDVRVADNVSEFETGGGIGFARVDRILFENNVSRYNAWWMVYGGSGFSSLVPVDFENNGDCRSVFQNNQSYGNETMAPCSASDTKFSDGNGIIIDVNRNIEGGFPTAGLAYRGRTLVQNNLVYNNGGSGIHAFNAQNVDIIHNTAYLNSASTKLEYPQIFAGYAKNVNIKNNILVAPDNTTGDATRNEPYISNGSQNVSNTIFYQNNLFYGLGHNITAPSGHLLTPTGNFTPNTTGDPLFLAPSRTASAANFRLRGTSPALNVGPVLAYGSGCDLTYRPRFLSGATDLGAYQTQANTAYSPILTPAPGNYSGTQTIVPTSDTVGARLIYTTNNTTPTVDSASGNATNGSVYTPGTSVITVSAGTTLKAIAWKSGLATSDISGGDYTFVNSTAVPIPDLIFYPDGGTYSGTTLMGIICRTPGAIVRYTIDGSTPSTTNGILVGAPMLSFSKFTTVKAIAYLPGRVNSAVKTANYTINGTLGSSSAGATTEVLGANKIRFSKFTAANANTIENIYARITGIGKYRVALYADSSGVPAGLLAASSTVVTDPTTAWSTFVLPAYNVVAGTVYWLAIWSDNPAAQIYSDTTGGTVREAPSSSPWPSSAGTTTASTNGAYTFSLYASAKNLAPFVSVANPTQTVTLPTAASLSATVTDDTLPKVPGATTVAWTKVSGPGSVTFANAAALSTSASFGNAGSYVLRVTANDGSLSATTDVSVTVNAFAGTATYIGSLSSGSTTLPITPDYSARFARFQAGGTFTAANIFARTVAAGANSVYRAALYADSGGATPQPGALLSRSTTRLADGPTGWNKFVLETPQSIAGGNYYWLAIWANNSPAAAIYANPTGGAVSQFSGNTLAGNGTWPNPSGASTLTATPNYTLSIYAAPAATNLPPVINAGSNQTISLPATAALAGTVTDDDLPLAPADPTSAWTQFSGPGVATFADATAPATTASFSLPGSYVLRLSATDGEASGTPSDVTIRVLDSYPAWAARFGVGSDTADSDGDGYSNLLEYGLNTNPLIANTAGQPVTILDSDGHLAITFLRLRGELNYTVESSNDLLTWDTIVTNPGNLGENATIEYNPQDSFDKNFIRLRVTRP